MFGSFKARAVPFNINYRYTASELEEILSQAHPTALVFESHFASLVREVGSCLRQCTLDRSNRLPPD